MSIAETHAARPPRLRALTDEGFRLFFVLSALHMALWPFLWVVVAGLDLPLAADTPPPTLWHAHELIVGSFGAALIGFLTTALPEWTDTEPLRGGRPLMLLAISWGGLARLIGLLGWDGGAAWLAGGLCDLGWLGALIVYAAVLSWRKWTDRFLVFLFWLTVLTLTEITARTGMSLGDDDLTQLGVYGTGFAFLGLLAIALGRITVPVTNLVLDPPTETSSPFRPPHPGRLTLAAGLVFIALVGEALGLSENIRGFLWIAAGAGFLDRVGEAFIGRASFRLEILMLAGSAALAGGAGLLLLGASLLGAPFGPHAGLHLAFMGGAWHGRAGGLCHRRSHALRAHPALSADHVAELSPDPCRDGHAHRTRPGPDQPPVRCALCAGLGSLGRSRADMVGRLLADPDPAGRRPRLRLKRFGKTCVTAALQTPTT